MNSSPHDGVFKVTFCQLELARGALSAIVSPALADALDWSALAVEPGSFVDAALAYQHTDLLYSLNWRDGSDALVYLLFEHQSTPPTTGLMGRRLMRYLDRIWDHWEADHPRAKTLPMILPIVLYHGDDAWPEPVAFEDLIDVPARLRPGIDPHLVRFTYVLFDLSRIADDELRVRVANARVKLTMMCLKHARGEADRFLQTLRRWADVAREVASAPNGLDALAQLMRYVVEVNELVTIEDLQNLLEGQLGPEGKDIVMTTGQQLRQEGRLEGRVEGRQEGHLEGRLEGRLEGLLQGRVEGRQELLMFMLRQRFGNAVTPQIEQQVAAAPRHRLETWSSRLFSASTLAELLAD